MSPTDSRISALLAKSDWQQERKRLRRIALAAGLDETVKWGKLCYTIDGGNVAIIQACKAYCALGLFRGALLEGGAGVLVAPGENSQAMRQFRFGSVAEIDAAEATIGACLQEAIALQRSGARVDFKARHELHYPDELTQALNGDSALEQAFHALTPGRRRGYVLHIAAAKRSATRQARIARCTPGILAGKGLQER